MSIKSIVKNFFWGKYVISQYHGFLSWILPKIIPDQKAILLYYKRKSGYWIDIDNPKTFSEKQQWYKLHARLKLMQKCADKLAVRAYVEQMGYGDSLNTLLAVYEKSKDITIQDLPDQFVIKATHGSSMNIIVKDKNNLVLWQAKLLIDSWLHQNIAWCGREWVYLKMPRRIIVEKYLEDETGELQDYKFFCFNGTPRFLQVTGGRYTSHKYQNFYDLDWNLLPFGKDIPSNPNIQVNKPLKLEYMIRMAKDLCKPFQFVRIDLYQVNGKVYFGEMTFFPAGGAPDFKPPEYDIWVGNMWKIDDIPNEV